MGSAVGGGSVRELASDHQAGGLALQLLGRLHQRGQGLVGTRGIHGKQIVVGLHRIGGNKARLGRITRHIARRGRSRITDGGVGRTGAGQSCDKSVEIKVILRRIVIGFIPSGSRQ